MSRIDTTPEQFLKRLEEITGKTFPVPPPEGPDDDCPICRALGMRNGARDGITDVGGARILTVRTKPPKRRR